MEFNAQITEKCKKYPVNTYASVEILLNTCRTTLDFMCDLELFSKIRSQIVCADKICFHRLGQIILTHIIMLPDFGKQTILLRMK